MMFNNIKYETLLLRLWAYTFPLFNSGSVVIYKSGSQTEMFSILLFLQFKNRIVVVKISKKSDIKQRVKNHKFKFFRKWSFKEGFSAETDEQGDTVSLVFKVCCDSLEGIKVD